MRCCASWGLLTDRRRARSSMSRGHPTVASASWMSGYRQEAFGQFFQERLKPAFDRVGVQVPEDMQPQFMPARNMLK